MNTLWIYHKISNKNSFYINMIRNWGFSDILCSAAGYSSEMSEKC